MFVRKLLNGANSEKVLIDHFLIDLSVFRQWLLMAKASFKRTVLDSGIREQWHPTQPNPKRK